MGEAFGGGGTGLPGDHWESEHFRETAAPSDQTGSHVMARANTPVDVQLA